MQMYRKTAGATSSWYLIVSGVGDQPSSRVVLLGDATELVFGRHADCDVVLDHDSVSRRHARFRRKAGQIIVEDTGSTNGTLVNGTAITVPRRLAAGDVVSIGIATAVVATTSAARPRRHVATVSELDDRLEAEVDRAVRYHRPLGLVMLRIAGPTEQMEDHVEAFLKTLRRMDLLAEYSPDELAIVLPETDRAATEAVVARAKTVPDGLTATAGAATFPEDGSHVGELIGIARERLRGIDRGARPHAAAAKPIVLDPKMKHVMELAKRVAPSSITVLVVGETGVGKEVVAEAIHQLGPRSIGPFVRLNCASLSETLVESELFGHDKGAFTGAVAAKPGFFEAASTGTLFLDEIGELPLATQSKLLRVLEQRRVIRVGGVRETPIDVRLVCATNRDLEQEVARGRFREDLYFRISAFVIPVPPLRDRRDEIVPLATQFAAELSPSHTIATLAPEAIALLVAYDWPGNVRELRNAIERAVVLGGSRIEPRHLPERMTAQHVLPPASPIDIRQRVASIERDAVIDALASSSGNQTKAARKLGISRFALIRMMEKHDLKKR